NMSQLLHEVDVPIKKATFALGCFWGPDSLFGAMKGVIRTRVGYCGGAKADPTYKSIYHQKYRLQQHSWLVKAVGLNSGPQLTSSHLAARLNGYVVGFGGIKQFESEIDRLGLDEKVADYVRKLVVKYEGRGLTC
ncbi:unnamed protein product, partial [Timema podura]|nr:unnamed protein product [Timema podura]